jgi:histidine triad (HIT) family protein
MDCIFCNIVKGVTPSKVIAHNKNAIAFLDVQPISDGHTLVISKEHYRDLSSCPPEVLADVMSLAQEVAKIINESKLRP